MLFCLILKHFVFVLLQNVSAVKVEPSPVEASVPKPVPIFSAIQTTHPISALFEYCKKGNFYLF